MFLVEAIKVVEARLVGLEAPGRSLLLPDVPVLNKE